MNESDVQAQDTMSFHNNDRGKIRWPSDIRDGSRAAATSKMERFVIIVNGWKLGCCSSPRSASGHVGAVKNATLSVAG